MEVNKHLKKFSENVKMKCILFKNKKLRGSENGASLSSWLIQVLIIAFADGSLAASSPARAELCFAKCESAKFSPLEMVPV